MLRNRLFNQILNVKNYIESLKSIHYYNKASLLAIESYYQFFSILNDHFESLEVSNYYPLYLQINQKFVPSLRFIERSSTNNVPWSLISNLDKILKKEFGENYFLLYRPQWNFNYSVQTTDLNFLLKSFLKKIFPSLINDIEKKFDSSKIHIFSFPVLQKSNVLLNSIIGHEIGHFFHNSWSESIEAKNILKDQKSELSNYYRKLFPGDIFEPYNKTEEGIRILQGMYREIISDLYGYLIFGPSMIFSLYYISLLESSSRLPSSETNYYPLIKYRIRILIKFLLENDKIISEINDYDNGFPFYLKKYLDDIKVFLKKEDDLKILEERKKEIELFENVLPSIITHLNQNIKYTIFKPLKPSELFNKLDSHIPINEINNKPVEIANIIFVGWIYHYKINSEQKDIEYHTNNKILMKMLMKSLFSTFIHQEYIDNQKKLK